MKGVWSYRDGIDQIPAVGDSATLSPSVLAELGQSIRMVPIPGSRDFQAEIVEPTPVMEMTLEEAVEVLRRFRHNGHGDWGIYRPCEGAAERVVGDREWSEDFTAWDAVAIAEKHLRGEGG